MCRNLVVNDDNQKSLMEKLFHAIMLHNGLNRPQTMINSKNGEFMLQFASTESESSPVDQTETVCKSKRVAYV